MDPITAGITIKIKTLLGVSIKTQIQKWIVGEMLVLHNLYKEPCSTSNITDLMLFLSIRNR